ncbi:MAG: hypothetical protein L3J82_01585 [Planctomycetes bacterium]|nr:hypothetical protein [Planctomycetota bacterium]
MNSAFFSLLVLLLAGAMSAQEFDPNEYFGPSKVAVNPKTGLTKVTDTLSNNELPSWLRVSVSGAGLAEKRFTTSKAGLELKPDKDSRTIEITLNAEIISGLFTIEVTEMAVKASVAWHISTEKAEYLVEVKRTKADEGRLRVKVFNGRRFMVMRGTNIELKIFTLPFTLAASVSGQKLDVELTRTATIKCSTKLEGQKYRAGLAVSDSRARVRDLRLEGIFSTEWKAEAVARMLAERALANLSVYALEGATRGLFQATHPEFAAQWQALTEPNRAVWTEAAEKNDFSKLVEQAGKSGGLLFEIGKLAVEAKEFETADSNFEASFKHSEFVLAKLAALELRHKVGKEVETIKAINETRKYLANATPAIQAEFDLMLARYRVANGEGLSSAAPLTKWADSKKARPALQAFARSAQELMQPSVPLQETSGPFGVRVLTDMPEAELAALLETLKPVISEIKSWTGEENPDFSSGYLAIYTDPVQYLTAALLPAGNNLDHVAGMFLRRGIGDSKTILACASFGRDELHRTLSHELWHMAVSEQNIPRWLDEGMAMCLSTAIDEGGFVKFAAIPKELDEIQRKQVFNLTAKDVEMALQADGQKFYGPEVRKNYALAWAWVWYLSQSSTGRKVLRKAVKGGGVDTSISAEEAEKCRKSLIDEFKDKES